MPNSRSGSSRPLRAAIRRTSSGGAVPSRWTWSSTLGMVAMSCEGLPAPGSDMPRGMRILVTGSSGHLGEALMRVLGEQGHDVIGLDVLASLHTTVVGSIADRAGVRRSMAGVDAVVHAATLHKPHVESHPRTEFVDTNITGTLNLLEEAVAAGARRVVFTSTTSTFGRALTPEKGQPAAWITEDVAPVPRNIYGTTKTAAENLCELIARDHGLPCLILRTSRFFPEADDRDDVRSTYADLNLKVNELLYRRVGIEDVGGAHLLPHASATPSGV